MRCVLVTGGAGFIGSHLVRRLLERHEDLHVVTVDALTYAGSLDNLADVMDDPRHTFVHADIRDAAAMARLFSTHRPDLVANLAAESHVDRSIASPLAFADTNFMGAATLLEAARAAWAGESGHLFLQVSTDEVYGDLPLEGDPVPFDEDSPLRPRSPYASSKAAADLMALSYATTYGLPVCITRSSNNYGTHQHVEKLVPLMVTRALAHEALPVYGDGANVRDWLHVDDNCAAIDVVLEHGVPGRVYNVAGGCELSNLAMVSKIVACIHDNIDPAVCEGLVRHVDDRIAHDRRYSMDSTRIGRELGWRPVVGLQEGLSATIDWYAGRI